MEELLLYRDRVRIGGRIIKKTPTYWIDSDFLPVWLGVYPGLSTVVQFALVVI